MKLYELSKSKKNVKEIELLQNPELIYQYKDKYVSRSNIYWFETTDKSLVNQIFREQKISSGDLSAKNKVTFYSSIDKIKDTCFYSELRRVGVMSLNSLVERVKMEQVLDGYLRGNYTCHNLLNVYLNADDVDINYCNHFLMLSDYEEVHFEAIDRYYYSIKNMLDLPSELYNLELLEQRRYDSFVRTISPWMEESLACYDFSSERNIGSMDSFSDINIEKTLEEDAPILSLYRKVSSKRAK